MTADHPSPEARAIRARITLASTAVIVAGLNLGAKTWAAGALNDGSSTDLGLLHLRLAFNPGVAFSIGDTLPPAVPLAVTGVIVVALALFAVRVAHTAAPPVVLALAATLGGAVANLIDRAGDGLVTDYLHTGWFPTFNLADVFVLASWRASDTADTGAGA